MKQLLLIDSPLWENGGGTVTPIATIPSTSAAVLNTQEAVEWAFRFVTYLPKGTTFTSMKLFEGIKLRGDKRARGIVLNALRRSGLITIQGLTQDDQEGRNNGYAALWEVV